MKGTKYLGLPSRRRVAVVAQDGKLAERVVEDGTEEIVIEEAGADEVVPALAVDHREVCQVLEDCVLHYEDRILEVSA